MSRRRKAQIAVKRIERGETLDERRASAYLHHGSEHTPTYQDGIAIMGSQVEFSPDTKPRTGGSMAGFDALQTLPDAPDDPNLQSAMSPTSRSRRTRGEPRLGGRRTSRRSVSGRDESLPGMVNGGRADEGAGGLTELG